MFARVRILVSILSALCALCGQSFAQQWKTVADGVEYAEVRREFSGKPVNINLLRLDLKKVRLDVHHAMDAAIGTEKTSSIAARHGGFAAINGGFFRLDSSIWAGTPAGALSAGGQLLGEPQNNRSVFVIWNGSPTTNVFFVRMPDRQLQAKIGGETLKITGRNRERRSDDFIMYTPDFHRTTLTYQDGVELTIVDGKIDTVTEGGSSIIPANGYILSASGKYKELVLRGLAKGRDLNFSSNSPYDLEKELFGNQIPRVSVLRLDYTNGVPQLIKNSKIDITWEQEKASRSFVETRHPRTAVAKLKDGKFLMLTADGRTEQSAGLDLYDLAAYFLELGATDAMNLDGGGSTTMFLDGKVVNGPSDKDGERKVGDAILVTLRKPGKTRK